MKDVFYFYPVSVRETLQDELIPIEGTIFEKYWKRPKNKDLSPKLNQRLPDGVDVESD